MIVKPGAVDHFFGMRSLATCYIEKARDRLALDAVSCLQGQNIGLEDLRKRKQLTIDQHEFIVRA
jgi:hypothetical protein